MRGKIIKGIAGLYYVHTGGAGIYECKAKGIFRKDNTRPLVGDNVELEILDEDKKVGSISSILPRKSALIRPAVANVDQALVIFAAARPAPVFQLLDRFLVMMRRQNLPCVICFNKSDLVSDEARGRLKEIYKDCGCGIVFASAQENTGIKGEPGALMDLLRGKTTTVAGPSGAGKSSIVNRLQDEVCMETGEISRKIERGRHTTRHSQLIALEDDTYIMDTPGFSSLMLPDMEKEKLGACYPEFNAYEAECRFGGCAHIGEPVCGIKNAVAAGKISRVRYENYALLYEELKNRKKY